jgi:hypothetical protein
MFPRLLHEFLRVEINLLDLHGKRRMRIHSINIETIWRSPRPMRCGVRRVSSDSDGDLLNLRTV